MEPNNIVARVDGVTHRYKATMALDGITLDLPSSRMIGLVGPDGVGKSTLMGLIAGARKLQSGGLSVLGGDMTTGAHRREVCTRIAYMPQGLGKNLYQNLSVRENLDFFGRLFGLDAKARKARINRLLRSTGLAPFPHRPAGKLSGGMKQKLGLCCALIHDPELLILDEPTTGVDPLSRRQLWQLVDAFRRERSDMSVIVSTAYMEEAERFDSLIAMDGGRVLATGSPESLLARTGTPDLERAFVALLPEDKRGSGRSLVITPHEVGDGEPAIVAEGLTRRFGTFTAVDDVSFAIEKGEIFGFLGSNGCGKTTTMKMLTGLLPPTSGTARLFGNPVDARNIETRRRVGYMSQAFSLYGQLTVRQNFNLHARLFHLSPDRRRARIAELVERFGLGKHMDELADRLPLGLRQRLSLAVAIIHEPEMLILDEPTSGVDPVARDGFWALLLDLSRTENVTIFISTHFMSEALRCDRISLMHAGKVLACDTAEALMEQKGTSNLDEAFISFMEDAAADAVDPDDELAADLDIRPQATVPDPGPGPDLGGNPGRPKAGGSRGFSPTRLGAYAFRESLEIVRDPIRLAFAFVGSIILLLILAYGLSSDVEDLRFAVLDLDQSPASRNYVNQFSSSRYFVEQPELRTAADTEVQLKDGRITLALEIPPNFGLNLKRGAQPEISAWIDGADTTRAATIQNYVEGAHSTYLQDLARTSSTGRAPPAIFELEPRFLYNPTDESINAIGPSVPALLLLLFPAILMAVSISQEKEIGTITNFYVTPTERLEFLLGKQLPYVVIGLVNFAGLTAIVVFVFGVPLKGDLVTLTIGALVYVVATTAFGLFVSSFTSNQVTAVFAAAILSIMPTMQFSGLLQPVSTLEGGASVMGSLWPTTYYMNMSVGVFTKGLGFLDLAQNIPILAAFACVFTLAAALALRKQEA